MRWRCADRGRGKQPRQDGVRMAGEAASDEERIDLGMTRSCYKPPSSSYRNDRFSSSETSSPGSGRLHIASEPLRGVFRTSSSSAICVMNVMYSSHAPSTDKKLIIWREGMRGMLQAAGRSQTICVYTRGQANESREGLNSNRSSPRKEYKTKPNHPNAMTSWLTLNLRRDKSASNRMDSNATTADVGAGLSSRGTGQVRVCLLPFTTSAIHWCRCGRAMRSYLFGQEGLLHIQHACDQKLVCSSLLN